MKKIQYVSYSFRVLFQACLVLLPAVLIIGWVWGPEIHLGSHQLGIGLLGYPRGTEVTVPITASVRLLGFIVSLMPTLISMALLYYLSQLFKCYERGEIFTIKTIKYIRNIGIILVAQVIVEVIYIVLINMVLNSLQNAGIDFSTISLEQVLLGLMIILNSWIMAEGYKLHQEQQLTI